MGVLFVASPFLGHVYATREVSSAIERLASDDPAVRSAAVETLRRFSYVVGDHDALVWSYDRERDPDQKARLAATYEALTGKDIENRLAILLD